MSTVIFTEKFTANELHKMFEERYVDFEETEMILNMMSQDAEIFTAWDNEGGCTVTISESDKPKEKISIPPPR